MSESGKRLSPPRVVLYTRAGCHLCEAVRGTIEAVRREVPFAFEQVDIDAPGQEAWRERYHEHVPVVHLNGAEFARYRLDRTALLSAVCERTDL